MINALYWEQSDFPLFQEYAQRVGAIVIQDNQVALIERLREDETLCHLFPGGQVEPG